MTLDRSLVLLACLVASACKSECVLDDDVRRFAGAGARDCGTAGAADARGPVDECVAESFEAGEAFIARYERAGIDSKVVTAQASNRAGDVKVFQWDSAPCGGSGCAPVTDVQSCLEPSLNPETTEDPDALPISCGRFGLPERLCE